MDTQGTFDSASSVKDCSIIFALSCLLASTQIYNIKSNITEADLQNLQVKLSLQIFIGLEAASTS